LSVTSSTTEAAGSLYGAAELYDAIVRPGPCEAFYRAEARRAGGAVLELGCGTGRLTLPIARDGHAVVGLDAAPAMLAAARRKAAAQGLDAEFVPGDMRDFDLGRRFALVIVSCNSLAHLTEEDGIAACLGAIRRHLAPGGTLAFDVALPCVATLARPAEAWRRLDLGPNPSAAIETEEAASYDPVTQIRTSRLRIRPPAGDARLVRFALRQFFPRELPLLLEGAGFELVARYGDFARNPLSEHSLNQICIARAAPRARHAAAPRGDPGPPGAPARVSRAGPPARRVGRMRGSRPRRRAIPPRRTAGGPCRAAAAGSPAGRRC
jgi:SAM-dependent methyltransferase